MMTEQRRKPNAPLSAWKSELLQLHSTEDFPGGAPQFAAFTNRRNYRTTGWKFLCNWKNEMRILLVGCAMDSQARQLAQNCRQLVLIDLDLQKLKFISQSCKPGTCAALSTNSSHLPFRPGSFDLIALTPGSSIDLSESLIGELKKLIKADGQLFFIFENKSMLNSILNQANLRSTRLTYRKTKRMLSRAGFELQSYFALQPGDERISQIASLKNDGWRFKSRAGKSLKNRVYNFINLGWRLKYSAPAFAVTAGLTEAQSAWLQRLMQSLEEKKLLNADRIGQVSLRNGDKMIVIPDMPQAEKVIIKIPIRASAVAECHKTVETVNYLRPIFERDNISSLLPQPELQGELDGFAYFVERAIPDSVSLLQKNVSTAKRSELFSQMAELLTDLHLKTATPKMADTAFIDQYFLKPITLSFDYLGVSPKQEILDFLNDTIESALWGTTIPLVCRHGDYGLHNVLLDKQTLQIKAIIDWDRSEISGLPVLDLFHLTGYNVGAKDPLPLEFLTDAVFPKNFNDDHNALITKYFKDLDIPDKTYPAFAIRYWIEWIFPFALVNDDQNLNRDWKAKVFDRVVKNLRNLQRQKSQ